MGLSADAKAQLVEEYGKQWREQSLSSDEIIAASEKVDAASDRFRTAKRNRLAIGRILRDNGVDTKPLDEKFSK